MHENIIHGSFHDPTSMVTGSARTESEKKVILVSEMLERSPSERIFLYNSL